MGGYFHLLKLPLSHDRCRAVPNMWNAGSRCSHAVELCIESYFYSVEYAETKRMSACLSTRAEQAEM